jgi:hypothetical protein
VFSDKDLQELVVSVGGKKVQSSPNAIDHLASNLPPDAAELLAKLQGQVSPPPKYTAVVSHETTEILSRLQANGQGQIPIRNVSGTNPILGTPFEQKPAVDVHQDLVRARSTELQLAHDRQQALEEISNAKTPYQRFTIYECGVALGIIVGSTNKAEVTEIMQNFSKISCPPDDRDLMFFYHDIQVTVIYNDDLIVSELQFGDYYRGQTSKGLQLGDPLEKAIEIYGPPRMKSPRGAFWNKFGVFCQSNRVNTIRIQA